MLSPWPDEMHFSATQKRRRREREREHERVGFRERKNMIPGVIIRAMAASERHGNALSRVGETRVVVLNMGISRRLPFVASWDHPLVAEGKGNGTKINAGARVARDAITEE